MMKMEEKSTTQLTIGSQNNVEKPRWKAEKLFPSKLAFLLDNRLYRMLSNIHSNPEKTVQWAGVEPGMNVLELGCGPGYYTPSIAKKVAPGTVTSVDLQQEMLDIVAKKAASMGLDNIATVKANAQKLPFEDSEFDLVWALYVLEEVADLERVAKELMRVLKPGATIAIAQVSYDFPKEQREFMKFIMPEVGFEKLDEHDGFWNYFVRYRKPA